MKIIIPCEQKKKKTKCQKRNKPLWTGSTSDKVDADGDGERNVHTLEITGPSL